MSPKPWRLAYDVYGRHGCRPLIEWFDTREKAERTARMRGLKHYEIWGRFGEAAPQ